MTETTLSPLERPRPLHFEWLLDVFFRPRQAFARIVAQNSSVWLTPILILTITALIQVLVAGSLRQAAAQAGTVELPPNFQYYTPEQQAQFQQAMAATSSPVFVYVFPAIIAISEVWVGWLLLGGLIHLLLTLLGGRGDTGAAMNLVAWAGLPYAVRDLVRAGSMFFSKQLITSPGLTGFSPAGDGSGTLFLVSLLALVDIYVIWHILLLVIGVRAGDGITPGKAVGAALLAVVLLLALQALISFLTARLGGLTVIRPFF